jgi:addiction module HigA family antidote
MPGLRTLPGEILARGYMKPLGVSANALGEAIGVPGGVSDIVRRRRGVSADAARHVCQYLVAEPALGATMQGWSDGPNKRPRQACHPDPQSGMTG